MAPRMSTISAVNHIVGDAVWQSWASIFVVVQFFFKSSSHAVSTENWGNKGVNEQSCRRLVEIQLL